MLIIGPARTKSLLKKSWSSVNSANGAESIKNTQRQKRRARPFCIGA